MLIVVRPAIQIKTIEGLALPPDRDFKQMRPHQRVKQRAVHAQVARGIAHPHQPRQEDAPILANHGGARRFGRLRELLRERRAEHRQ